MKVCTDSCLFGAWTASVISDYNINNILDIGTGTGLLSLMLVQKFPDADCHAIEIDKEASEEASMNFIQSKWKDKLTIFNQDFVNFEPRGKYDLIICNPPFYNNQLTSPFSQKNAAMHSSHFSFDDLFKQSKTYLSEKGNLSCLIPYNRTSEIIEIAGNHGWYPKDIGTVKQTSKHDYFRTMIIFCITPTPINTTVITIKDNNLYTNLFNHLLKDYYLIYK